MENNKETIDALESTVIDAIAITGNVFDALRRIFYSPVCATLAQYNIVDKLYGLYLRELVERIDSVQIVSWNWKVHDGRCVLELVLTEAENLSFTLVWDLPGVNTYWSTNPRPISLASDTLHLLDPVSVSLDFGSEYVHRPLFHLGCVSAYLTLRDVPIQSKYRGTCSSVSGLDVSGLPDTTYFNAFYRSSSEEAIVVHTDDIALLWEIERGYEASRIEGQHCYDFKHYPKLKVVLTPDDNYAQAYELMLTSPLKIAVAKNVLQNRISKVIG